MSQISREKAVSVAPDYVAFVEGDFDKFGVIDEKFSKLKRGQKVISQHPDGYFVEAKVSSVNHDDFRAIDGPIVRVSDGKSSWRVDGDAYAYPL